MMIVIYNHIVQATGLKFIFVTSFLIKLNIISEPYRPGVNVIKLFSSSLTKGTE